MEDLINTDPLLTDVESFLQSSGITATSFGQQAVNDPALVHEMRRGRECKRSIRNRILQFIASTPAAA